MLLSIRRPSSNRLVSLCENAEREPLSYAPRGLTRSIPRSGYNVDRYETVLGRGADTFRVAATAIRRWEPLALGWMVARSTAEAVELDAVVAIAARVLGVWFINLCRVVYVVDEPRRFGFAYGTLRGHAETGEELFVVEQDEPPGDVVWFRVVAVSRPRHFVVRLGYPVSRWVQSRFGHGVLAAMKAACRTRS